MEEYFKDNKNAAFITISTDEDKTTWIKSIESGRFTTSYVVNLYTNSEGSNNTVIKNFNVVSCPKPFLLDKDGKISSFSTTDLRIAGEQKVIELIKTLL